MAGPTRPAIAPVFMARASLLRSIDFSMVSRATGAMMAAEAPCSSRAATNIGSVPDNPHSTEASANPAIATRNTRRVPK